ncbi:MAG: histidine kinase [Sphingomonadales bacterium]|nr:histidine kinase [Sphingomonadales bacterium]
MLVAADGVVQDIMVRDFSSKGFSAATRGTAPHRDEVVTVLLPDNRALWGIVRWVKGNVFGVEFDVNTPPEPPMKSAPPARHDA